MIRKIFPLMLLSLSLLFPFTAYSYYESDAYNDGDNYYNQNNYHNGYRSQQYGYYDSSQDDYYNSNYRPHRKTYRQKQHHSVHQYGSYSSRLPQTIGSTEKTIVVDPNVHAWGAYEDGRLIHSGIATAGSSYCRDLHRPCHTSTGTFRIWSLGSSGCKSSKFPLGRGGAPMPYCMYFNRTQALHGSYEVTEGNISHGCVRLHVADAEWIRFNFARVGTKVIIKPY